MIPGIIHDIVENRWGVSIGNIAVPLNPVCALFQGHEPAEPGFASDKILGALFICTESASYQLAVLIKGVEQPLYIRFGIAGQHFAVCFVEVVEVGIAVRIRNGLPAGGKHAHTGIVAVSILLKDSGELFGACTINAQIVPENPLFSADKAVELLHTGENRTILIVRPYAFLSDPPLFVVLLQIEGVLNVCNAAHKVSAVVIWIIGAIVVGIQAVLFLIFRVGCQGLQDVEVGVDVIVQFTCDGAFQHSLIAPYSVFLCLELQPAEYA